MLNPEDFLVTVSEEFWCAFYTRWEMVRPKANLTDAITGWK